MFNQFMVSGVTFVETMLKIYANSGRYFVAEHEFIKAVMLGDHQFYKEKRSTIINLFEVSGTPNASNLTSLHILTLLDRHNADAHPEGAGFIAA